MKKISNFFGTAIFFSAITLIVAACNNDQMPVTLESITVTVMPSKTAYVIGEVFNSTGMEITAFYDDGTSGPVTGYTLSGFDSVMVGGKIVTVSYGEKTAVFMVTVNRTLESITVTAMPSKTAYVIGEAFNSTGMEITAFYDDETSGPVTGYTLSGFDSTMTRDVTVTVSFEGKTATFIVIIGRTLENIIVTATPEQTVYKIREAFNSTGMEITAFYDDGTSEPVTGYTLSGFDSATAGGKIVTVSYGGKTAVFMVMVNRTLESIIVTTMPSKTAYVIGEAFNSTGMVVAAFYDDDTSGPVVGYTLSGFDSTMPGNVVVVVSFDGKIATFTITVWQAEIFNISFSLFADHAPEIKGPVIYLLERKGKPSSAVVAVDAPDQYDPYSISWYIEGNVTIGNSIILNSENYSLIGEYSITVIVRKDGIPYNKTVTFTVAP